MKGINWGYLILALLVVTMFIAVGVAISFRSIGLIILFIVLGFGIMGYGISLKQRGK